MIQLTLWGLLFKFYGQLAPKFHREWMCFGIPSEPASTSLQYVHPSDLNQLTIEQAHKEYNSLVDK